MNKKIFKYKIEVEHEQVIKIPKGSKLVDIQVQNGEIKMWAVVDEAVKEVDGMRIMIAGTGRPIHFDLEVYEHLKTVQIENYVWHIYVDKQHIKRFR